MLNTMYPHIVLIHNKIKGGGTAKMLFIDKTFLICYDQFRPISFDIAKAV